MSIRAADGTAPVAIAAGSRAASAVHPPKAGALITVSVVIVNWNVRDLLRDCLESVFRATRMPADAYDVLVIDNDSTDGSADMVEREFPQVRLIRNSSNVGFARANNQALRHCRGRFILLLNPDTVVGPCAIDDLCQAMEDAGEVGVIGCRLLNSNGTYQRWTAGALPTLWRTFCHAFFIDAALSRWSGHRAMFLSRDVRNDITVDWVSGACMLVRRTAISNGLFDESFFMYGEDAELCTRLRRDGWAIRYTPAVSVTHHHGRSMAQQQGAILLTSLKGPRAFFAMHHGRAAVRGYDLLMTAGFAMRWWMYGCAALLTRREHYVRRAAALRDYTRRSIVVMRGG